jgi:hypothetical protein
VKRQIALADNKHHRFALVEFRTGLEAEHVVHELVAKYTAIHVEYCGPGETPADAYHWITTVLPIRSFFVSSLSLSQRCVFLSHGGSASCHNYMCTLVNALNEPVTYFGNN